MGLYKTFVDAGLPEPTLHFEAPMGGPEDWAGYEYLANSFRSLVPLMEAYGIATADNVDVDTLAARIQGGSRLSETTDYVTASHYSVRISNNIGGSHVW